MGEFEISPLQIYLKEISKYERLTKKEIEKLWKIKNKKTAKEKLFLAHTRLVIPVAVRYHKKYPDIDIMDLIESGNRGLLRAIEKFKPSKKIKLSTYATYWIDQAIRKEIQMQTGVVKITSYINEQVSKYLKAKEKLKQELKREPTILELSKKLKLSPTKIRNIQKAISTMTLSSSMDETLDEDTETTFSEFIEDREAVKNYDDEIFYVKFIKEKLKNAIQKLEPKERKIIKMKFYSTKPVTLEAIGRKFKISRERARQIINEATKKIVKFIVGGEDGA